MLWGEDALDHHLSGLVIVWATYLGTCYLLFKHQRLFNRFSIFTIPWIFVIGVAISLRIQVIFAEPWLADDYQRYLFDGKLLLAGLNPYAIVPLDHPELGGAAIPKPEIKTIYPPLAEALFAFAASSGGTLLTWRVINLIPDLVGVLIFRQILKRFGSPSAWLILWLWNPLILKEGLHSAHLEIWLLFAVTVFLYFAILKQIVLASLALGCAVLIKLTPLLLLPAWLSQIATSRKKLLVLTIFLCQVVAGFAWFFPYHPFISIAVFLQHVQGYGALYLSLSGLLDLWSVNTEWTKGLLISFAIATYIYTVFSLRYFENRTRLALLQLFILFFVFSSMGFPWYLMAALPWILVTGNWLWILFFALSHIHFYAWQLEQPVSILPFLILLTLFVIHKSRFHFKESEA